MEFGRNKDKNTHWKIQQYIVYYVVIVFMTDSIKGQSNKMN